MAAAQAFPDNEVGIISEDILGLTARQAIAITNNGWENLLDFEGYTTDDIETWISTTSKLPVNRGGVSFPSVRARRLCALNYWLNRRLLRGVPVVAVDFDANALAQALVDYPIMDMARDANDTVDKPEQFNYDKWVDWQDSVITYLKGKKNITKNIPLYYVIRPAARPARMTEEDEIIHHAPLAGAAFISDNRTVHQVLTELTNGTDADHWIKDHRRSQDGRAAWNDLCNHYDGPAEGDKRVTVARHDIKIIHYRNESSFSFEKYSTRLKKAFSTLVQYGQPKSEKEKVEILLDQINTNDSRLITVIGICRDSHSRTFEDACTYLSQQIATIYPQHQPNAFGKRGNGGKRHKTRGIHALKTTKGGKTFCNGVDITNTTKYYSKEDFEKMGKEGRDYLHKCPKRKASREAHLAKKKSRGTDNQRQVAAIINGVMQASRHENDSINGSGIPSHIGGGNSPGNNNNNNSSARMPQHGTHARQINSANVSQGSNSRGQQAARYDHNGDIVPPS